MPEDFSPFKWSSLANASGEVTLKKLTHDSLSLLTLTNSTHSSSCIRICVLDTETTGMSPVKDKIIDIALVQIVLDLETKQILGITDSYEGLEDPGFEIPSEITALTGIRTSDVEGKVFDRQKIHSIIESSDFLLAHNANFDRGFLEANRFSSAQKKWACSIENFKWKNLGYPSQALELLITFHGYYTSSHRAMKDVEALIFILNQKGKTYSTRLAELIHDAQLPKLMVHAQGAPFEKKDDLKARSYRWNTTQRVWEKTILEKDFAEESDWLQKNIYKKSFSVPFTRLQ